MTAFGSGHSTERLDFHASLVATGVDAIEFKSGRPFAA
jgi:hypothetical protein